MLRTTEVQHTVRICPADKARQYRVDPRSFSLAAAMPVCRHDLTSDREDVPPTLSDSKHALPLGMGSQVRCLKLVTVAMGHLFLEYVPQTPSRPIEIIDAYFDFQVGLPSSMLRSSEVRNFAVPSARGSHARKPPPLQP